MPSIKPDYPLDSVVLAVMREVDALIKEMKLSYFVCGAVARDILLHHVHGIRTGRTTADVDFAVAVETWEQFYEIKDRLIKTERFQAAGESRSVFTIGPEVEAKIILSILSPSEKWRIPRIRSSGHLTGTR